MRFIVSTVVALGIVSQVVWAQEAQVVSAEDLRSLKTEVVALQNQVKDLVGQMAALAQRIQPPSADVRGVGLVKTLRTLKALIEEQFGEAFVNACRPISAQFDVNGKLTGFVCQPR